MVQDFIVAVIVLASVLYAFWMLMPAVLRSASAAALAAAARRLGLGEQRSQSLHASLAANRGCGQCDGCKGCAIAPGKPRL